MPQDNASHRRCCERANGSGEQFDISCDMVIKAVGQTKMRSFFTDVASVEVDEKGRVVVNEKMQTSDPKVFAGGDCVNGGGEAVEAAKWANSPPLESTIP